MLYIQAKYEGVIQKCCCPPCASETRHQVENAKGSPSLYSQYGALLVLKSIFTTLTPSVCNKPTATRSPKGKRY